MPAAGSTRSLIKQRTPGRKEEEGGAQGSGAASILNRPTSTKLSPPAQKRVHMSQKNAEMSHVGARWRNVTNVAIQEAARRGKAVKKRQRQAGRRVRCWLASKSECRTIQTPSAVKEPQRPARHGTPAR